MADLEIGETIYGTEKRGAYRRYVATTVLDHWSTTKPAYRVTLEDGTELVASGDHRFLTERGWKHVAGNEYRRPYVKPGDQLVGPGEVTAPVLRALVPSGSSLKVIDVEPLGIEIPLYDITTGTGDFIANGVVSHNCFARSTHTFMDMNAGRDFESKIVVKVNAPEVLRRQLRAKRWKGEHVAMGTATDPYQRAEGRYKLMPGILQALTEVRNPFSILTKGTLILRDMDLLLDAAEVTDVSTAFSIGTLDADAWRKSEPGTPHPRKRMDAVKKLNEAGIPSGVMVAPVLPGITDGIAQVKEVVHAAVDAGATHVTPILLHLRPKVKEVYMDWLGETYPHLVDRYEAMYGRGAYASNEARAALGKQVGQLLDEAPKPPAKSWRKTRNFRVDAVGKREPSSPPNEQLSLI
ncbi:MAG: radical SAM protein [Actinomycetota bacterium]|nr:radical SAM protein [Actinomycetota bacterium]